jgi:hypothetical protein
LRIARLRIARLILLNLLPPLATSEFLFGRRENGS